MRYVKTIKGEDIDRNQGIKYLNTQISSQYLLPNTFNSNRFCYLWGILKDLVILNFSQYSDSYLKTYSKELLDVLLKLSARMVWFRICCYHRGSLKCSYRELYFSEETCSFHTYKHAIPTCLMNRMIQWKFMTWKG